MTAPPRPPYDATFPLGPDVVACVYDVGCRASTDVAAATALAQELRARLQAGRAERPHACHYVNLVGERPDVPGFAVLPQAARDIVMPVASELADSIAVMSPHA